MSIRLAVTNPFTHCRANYIRTRKRSAIASVAIAIILLFVGVGVLALVAIGSSSLLCSDCSDRDLTMTLSSIVLYSGTASSNTSRGTAALTMSANDPGAATGITSISLTGSVSPQKVFQCSNKISCVQIQAWYAYSAPLAAGAVSYFDTNTTAFYFSAAITSGQVYNYAISFANGQSDSGELTSQPAQSLPAGPSVNYSNTSTSSSYSYSSTCTASPYSTIRTINSSQSIYTTVVTVYC